MPSSSIIFNKISTSRSTPVVREKILIDNYEIDLNLLIKFFKKANCLSNSRSSSFCYKTQKNIQIENIRAFISNLKQKIDPYTLNNTKCLSTVLYLFIGLYLEFANNESFKITLNNSYSVFGDSYSTLKFTIYDKEIVVLDIQKADIEQVNYLLNNLANEDGTLKKNITLELFSNCLRAPSYLSCNDNSPKLLEFFNYKKQLFTYGLQALGIRKPFAECVRDNYNAFNNSLERKNSKDYTDWTSPGQQVQIKRLEKKCSDGEIAEDILENLLQVFNPDSLGKFIPGTDVSYADDYKNKLDIFLKIIQPYRDSDDKLEFIISAEGELNPVLGIAIKKYIVAVSY